MGCKRSSSSPLRIASAGPSITGRIIDRKTALLQYLTLYVSSQGFIMVLMSGRGSGLEQWGGGGFRGEGCCPGGHKHTQEDAHACKHSFTHTRVHIQTLSGWQAQQSPSQAAIRMEMALIAPTDHTGSARQACWGRAATLPHTSRCLGRDPISAITNQSLSCCWPHAADCFSANLAVVADGERWRCQEQQLSLVRSTEERMLLRELEVRSFWFVTGIRGSRT